MTASPEDRNESTMSPASDDRSEPTTAREVLDPDPAARDESRGDPEAPLDDPDAGEFPAAAATDPGNTTTDSTVACPFCGEPTELFLEPGGDRGKQEFVEECPACSRDFEVEVDWDDAGVPHIHTDRTQ